MFRPSSLFTPGCILPAGKELRIFGDAAEGSVITAVLTGHDGAVLTQGAADTVNGRFLCLLPAVAEPQTDCILTLSDGTDVFTIDGVAVGLLFLAGGQSNMELALWNADGGRDLVAAHDDPDLRYFNVPRMSVENTEADTAMANARWSSIKPGTGGDMSGVGYFFARKLRRALNIPVGIIDCYWGGTSVTAWMDETCLRRTAEGARYLDDYAALAGDKTLDQWQAEEDAFQQEMSDWNGKVDALRTAHPGIAWADIEAAAGKCPWHPPVGPGSPYRPGGLAQTMLSRIVPVSLTAMLYYQGEEDAGKTALYDQLLCGMITYWRELFMDMQLPFLNMQLPMYAEQDQPEDGLWPALRLAQQKAADLSANSRLACIIDCGELGNIHPTDKLTPGERLADEYLAFTGDVDAAQRCCPRVLSRSVYGDRIRLTADMPLRSCDEPALFEIAGTDGIWHTARAVIDSTMIDLSCADVPRPVSARYAWASYAVVNVFGENGAPLRPFAII